VGGFARVRRFVNGGRKYGEGEASVVKNFGAAGGSGREDEFHGETFLQAFGFKEFAWP
jgi:hypothetical protein